MPSWKEIPRSTLLKIVAGAAVGLFVLDSFVIEPAFHAWGEQGERITALQKKVDNGRKLLDREKIIRGRWDDMQRANLADDNSTAGGDILNAVNRWKLASGVGLSSFNPQWQEHEDLGYDENECRATASGDQKALGRFLYELETDPIPVNLEECEIATREANGRQLTLTARFSFARLTADAGNNGSGSGRSAR